MSAPYQLLPPLTDDEFAALRDDIAANGVLVPVEIDEHGNVLDGHHRLRAADELDIAREDVPTVVRRGMTDEQKLEHAATLNLARRQLSTEQQVEVVATLRKRGMSIRRIAKLSGIPRSTVQRYLRAVPDGTPEEVVGEDGKSYAASRPRVPRGTRRNGQGWLVTRSRPFGDLAWVAQTPSPTADELEADEDGRAWVEKEGKDAETLAMDLAIFRGRAAASMREVEALGDMLAQHPAEEAVGRTWDLLFAEDDREHEERFNRIVDAVFACPSLESFQVACGAEERRGWLDDGACRLVRLDAKVRRLDDVQVLRAYREVVHRHPKGEREGLDFNLALEEVLDDEAFQAELDGGEE